MGKHGWLFGLILGFLFVFVTPLFAHADSSFEMKYDIVLNGFYWGTSVATPQFKNNSASFGGTMDVRFKPGSGMDRWGFGLDFTNTNNGPRYFNTNGAFVTTVGGSNGGSAVSLGNGLFGFVAPGTYQLGGIKLKYFFPVSNENLAVAVYGNYLFSTGNFSALGGGGELTWKAAQDFYVGGFADVSNNVGNNGFPAQTLLRYQVFGRYNIPDSSLHLLLGYRGYNYYNFNTSYINGFIAGAGVHF